MDVRNVRMLLGNQRLDISGRFPVVEIMQDPDKFASDAWSFGIHEKGCIFIILIAVAFLAEINDFVTSRFQQLAGVEINGFRAASPIMEIIDQQNFHIKSALDQLTNQEPFGIQERHYQDNEQLFIGKDSVLI